MEDKKERALFSGVIYLSLMGSSLICAYINGMDLFVALSRTCYSLIFGAVFLVLLHGREDFLWKQISNKKTFLLAFAVSVCLASVSSRYNIGIFWMLLLAVVCCQEEMEIKIASYGILMAVYLCNALMVRGEIALLEYYLVIGIVLLLVLSMVKRLQEVPYAGVILVTLCLSLLILQNGFDFERMWYKRYNIIVEIGSLVFLILFYIMLRMVRQGIFGELGEDRKTPGLMELLQEDFVLMQQLKENETLYRHASEVSWISSLAAKEISCDSILAGAGGMYHEVGRLLDQEDYMEANMELAREYQFPERLQEVIRQHNTASEVPQSPEAAIVMLTDCIIATAQYLDKSGKRSSVSNEKLVRNIFSNRISKGSLDESGLSVEDIKKLEKFYIDNVSSS